MTFDRDIIKDCLQLITQCKQFIELYSNTLTRLPQLRNELLSAIKFEHETINLLIKFIQGAKYERKN